MKPAPTLADMLIREWSKPLYRHFDGGAWVPRTIAQARKFVLTTQMSEYLADLANSWLPGFKKQRKGEILNGYRMDARLPHPITWVEYDPRAFQHRQRMQWPHLFRNKEEVSLRHHTDWTHAGWLLLQHPKIETAFMVLTAMARGSDRSTDLAAYGIVWSADDSMPPYRDALLWKQGHDDTYITGVLTGLRDFHCPQLNVTLAPWLTGKQITNEFFKAKPIDKWLIGRAGTIRVVWPFLAAINNTPKATHLVKPTGGHMVSGSYKRFMDHTVIDLNLPKRATMQLVAKRALLDTRRRAHMRRGHFRRHWEFPFNPRCQHELEAIPDSHMHECKLCGGRKIWIAEYQAGDASLGWVTHDYSVHHKTGDRR